MEHKTTPVPSVLLVGITFIILTFVIISVWLNTLHRPDIQGTWKSMICEDGIKREMTLTPGTWNLTTHIFDTKSCLTEIRTEKTQGTYELGDKSKEVPGATHAEFKIKPPQNGCSTNFDLVKREDNLLYLGDQSESHCTRGEWPKKLNPFALQKQN